MKDLEVPEREGEVVAIYNLEGMRIYSMSVHPCVPSHTSVNLEITGILYFTYLGMLPHKARLKRGNKGKPSQCIDFPRV